MTAPEGAAEGSPLRVADELGAVHGLAETAEGPPEVQPAAVTATAAAAAAVSAHVTARPRRLLSVATPRL